MTWVEASQTINLFRVISLPSPLLVLLDAESEKAFKHKKSDWGRQRPINGIFLVLCHLPNSNRPMRPKHNSGYYGLYGCNQPHICLFFFNSKPLQPTSTSSLHRSKAVNWRLTRIFHSTKSKALCGKFL